MTVGRLSSKGQVPIPKKIREILGLKTGYMISYEVHNGMLTVKRVVPFYAAFHASLSKTLGEWDTPEDDEAFRDL